MRVDNFLPFHYVFRILTIKTDQRPLRVQLLLDYLEEVLGASRMPSAYIDAWGATRLLLVFGAQELLFRVIFLFVHNRLQRDGILPNLKFLRIDFDSTIIRVTISVFKHASVQLGWIFDHIEGWIRVVAGLNGGLIVDLHIALDSVARFLLLGQLISLWSHDYLFVQTRHISIWQIFSVFLILSLWWVPASVGRGIVVIFEGGVRYIDRRL